MKKDLITIIIPCYNSSNFVIETIQSILVQKKVNIEIILIDDGSTDDLVAKISIINDSRLSYVYQKNSGVSAARNHGLKLSNGEYIVFFDADDIMTEDFLFSRLDVFLNSNVIDYVCGEVQKFNKEGLIPCYYQGTSSDAINEILFYNNSIITCPSNFMFKKIFLNENQLLFNEKLSSTADRYFLIECSKVGKGFLHKNAGMLLYRVSENSMSHQLSHKLVLDNQVYYEELIKHRLIPDNIRNKSLFLGNFILFASYWKIQEKQKSIKFAFLSFTKNPVGFIKKCIN